MRSEVRISAVHSAPAGDFLASIDVSDPANKQALLRQCMFVSGQVLLLPQVVRGFSQWCRSAAGDLVTWTSTNCR